VGGGERESGEGRTQRRKGRLTWKKWRVQRTTRRFHPSIVNGKVGEGGEGTYPVTAEEPGTTTPLGITIGLPTDAQY
jgi:hypothetical protein